MSLPLWLSPTIILCFPPLVYRTRYAKVFFACQTEDDWDDEGATGITFEACEAAVQFLEEVWKYSDAVPVPGISPSVYGAVSLHWRSHEAHLIVRPSANSASYRQEKEGSESIYADVSTAQAVQRVLNLLKIVTINAALKSGRR